MKDRHGRKVDYMRISITEYCNYRCFYCMPNGSQEVSKDYLTKKEILDIVRAGVKIGISKVRITGGEPLVRGDLEEIVKGISDIKEIKEVCITTNGSLLFERIDGLYRAGLTRVNVSLDTLDSENFKRITNGGNFERVWSGIEKTISLGISLRVNTVLVRGVNDNEINKLVDLTVRYPLDLRFIELMPIGEGKKYNGLNEEEIIKNIKKIFSIERDSVREGVSTYYKVFNSKGRVGFINPISNCFCEECNKIRVTAKGILKQCLNKKSDLSLRGLDGSELDDLLKSETYNKPEKHLFFQENLEEDTVNMNKIGG